MTQNREYIEQHNNLELCVSCPIFEGFTLAVALQLKEKHGKNLRQGSRRVPAGTMKIHKHTIRIHRHNNEDT